MRTQIGGSPRARDKQTFIRRDRIPEVLRAAAGKAATPAKREDSSITAKVSHCATSSNGLRARSAAEEPGVEEVEDVLHVQASDAVEVRAGVARGPGGDGIEDGLQT